MCDVCEAGHGGWSGWGVVRTAAWGPEAGAVDHAGDAFRGGRGERPHAVGLRCGPSRRVRGAGADERVDEGFGVDAEAAALFDGEGGEAVVGVGSEDEVAVLTDLVCRRCSRGGAVDYRCVAKRAALPSIAADLQVTVAVTTST